MRAVSTVVVAAGGVLEHVACQPPLTVRKVRAERSDTCALCLVGTAAGPLAGDDLTLRLELRDSAHATLQATGASLAQGRGAQPGSLRTEVTLGTAARLYARPAPVVVGAGARADIAVDLRPGTDAAIDWQELVVLGRTAEAPGAATIRWNVVRDGRPVLRQFVDLTDPELVAWPGLVAGGRVIAGALICDPDLKARTIVADPTAVAARLDEHTVLLTVLGADAAGVTRRLDALRAEVRG